MKKSSVFFLILLLSPFIGGLYGVLHDQITFTISPEYYTKFKFYQFGFVTAGDEWVPDHIRLYVSLVGFLATWWVGLIIGVVLALTGLFQENAKRMFRITLRAIVLTLLIAIVAGILGYLYSISAHDAETIASWLPANIDDKQAFYSVGSIHNFSYLGGLIGLVIAGVWSFWKSRFKDNQQSIAPKN
ncbi:hypothetical protein [Flavilitoribacter nigricans]|uniref:Signal peptide-containing protein n=1 Tax=Flavilitoribacter nigricans (strain ATCC 23147 / DSM 23189 / NBRC 102662 / NCIMB 1420 / SS-2) TaxID=1122177 RepID=A0A2D0N765_FLAN2|nr:hypothetical protein [Flavilitoribacter nigricans]PHN04307.1 hypothetical protein CRP01_22350 [Flavilitoribacter nigricans DSM 23189 = NBRC 102662]